MNNTDRRNRRKTLTADVIERVQSAIQEELEAAPQSLTEERREAIEEQVLAHTRLLLDALSVDEMLSEGALFSHIANARFDVSRLIHQQRP